MDEAKSLPAKRTRRRVEGLLVECRGCGRMLPRGWFRRRVRAGKVVLRSQCRSCEKPVRAAAAATRRKRVKGSYSGKDVTALAERQGWCCVGCGVSLYRAGYHVDHIVPISKGGLNVAGNIQLLCPRCNLSKGAK